MIFIPGESSSFVDYQEVPVTMGFTHRPARKNAGMTLSSLRVLSCVKFISITTTIYKFFYLILPVLKKCVSLFAIIIPRIIHL